MGRFNWDWGKGEPPTDAYSRVTEPERFRPLINWALEAVARLQTEYEVTLDEGEGMDAELELAPLSRPTIRLTPLQDSCAPITIAFTDFPALGVRVGRWVTDFFPYCGCDACDEMPEEEIERFTELLSDVVAGRFRESVRLQSGEDGWSSREFWPDEHRSCGESRVPRVRVSRIADRKEEIVLAWLPWQPKPDDTATC